MPAAGLVPQPATTSYDWYGDKLRSEHIRRLIPGCVVRVQIKSTQNNGSENLYFEITKIKDGTYWGVTKDTYRTMADVIGLADGEVMTFRKEHIMEVPMGKVWQPKAYRKAVEHVPIDEDKDDEDRED